ncbi:UNVERIFIED_CONTAM: hypothetical protein GTU68_036936, partial [Idotea baltica]|nr:hypothetical protein [Idotea baltica]
MKENGYRLYAFNTLISSRLSLHRPLPDTRHEKCLNKRYPRDLPSTSIVVCFFRENLSTLLRSVHSILDRTPENILKEIILVDDTDEVEYHLEVKGAVSGLSDKVILLKTDRREGLIRARIFGAKAATGKVLVFLDSHVEVNKVWLEPLLARIQEQRTNVVTPVIDVISPDTFKYVSASLVRGGFN